MGRAEGALACRTSFCFMFEHFVTPCILPVQLIVIMVVRLDFTSGMFAFPSLHFIIPFSMLTRFPADGLYSFGESFAAAAQSSETRLRSAD